HFSWGAFDFEHHVAELDLFVGIVRIGIGHPEAEATVQRDARARQITRRRAGEAERGLRAAIAAVRDHHWHAGTAWRWIGRETRLVVRQRLAVDAVGHRATGNVECRGELHVLADE